MQVTFKNHDKQGKIAQNRKENHFWAEYAVIGSDLKTVCTLRFYGTNAKTYACFWLHRDDYRSGAGNAGGYGYHRPSAAAESAFRDADIYLSESISGVGDTAIKEALLAIARKATGKRKFIVHYAHA